MKKYLLFLLLFSPLYGALSGEQSLSDPKEWQDLPDSDFSLSELEAHANATTTEEVIDRSIETSAVVAALTAASKTGTFKSAFPQLFPRGAASDLVKYGIATVAASGALWVGISYVRSLFALSDAHANLLKVKEEITKANNNLKELQELQTQQDEKLTEIQAKNTEAHSHALTAKTSMEQAAAGLETFITKIGEDDDKRVAIIASLLQRVNDLEKITQQMVLKEIAKDAADQPDMDALTKKANELEQSLKRFATTEDLHKNEAAKKKAQKKSLVRSMFI